MSSDIQDRVLAATMTCLRPLARVLLRSGINYRQFAEAAKSAFLEEAASERDRRGNRANVSRIAVRTGLSRKEVSRMRDASITQSAANLARHFRNASHAARTLQFWYSDARFVDAAGRPKDLSFSGDDESFTALVRAVGGDVPPGAVRAELLAAGSIVETATGSLKAVRRYFVPGNIDEDLVVGLAQIVHPVIEGLARNTGAGKSDPFLQRLSYSDRLFPAAVPLFRQIARERSANFVQSIDDWLSSNETNSECAASPPLRVGVGVFYFEGTPPSETDRLTSDSQ
jgi:hypothetical protein